MSPQVDNYLAEGCLRCPLGSTPDCKVHSWPEELILLRKLVIKCGLTEELKWGVPCYTLNDKNVLLVSAFKGYAAISFFKGSLLSNPAGLLIAPGPNSQASRYLKFTDTRQIIEREATIKAYVFEAIEVEKAGLEVSFKKNPEPIPDELQQKMDEDPVFRSAFEGLTPGRQRGYILHFSQPKQSQTRMKRIEKYTPMILNGEGMHDKYKSMSRKKN